MAEFHPELRRAARLIPRFSFTPRLARLARFIQRLRGIPKPPAVAGLTIRDVVIPGPASNPELRVRVYAPDGAAGARPAMLWVHGGGFIVGTPEQDQANNIALCRDLGMVVVAVNYRLGPDHPYPAGLDDCYAALEWLHRRAGDWGVREDRIAIGGNSAGAGLAAGLALFAHDRGEVPVACQLLIYPMLDDRTTLRTDIDQANLRLWNSPSNVVGWTSYLGRKPGGEGVPEYAAPARRERLAGLPPAWIGVGTCDLFHDEDLAYAERLSAAGVPCTLVVVEGAFHGFDLVGQKVPVARDFRDSYVAFLRRATLCSSR
jgi:acetyl esterase/lipase